MKLTNLRGVAHVVPLSAIRSKWRSLTMLGSSTILAVSLALFLPRVYSYRPIEDALLAPEGPTAMLTPDESRHLETEAKLAEQNLAHLLPRSTYIVIDRFQNRLFVKKGARVIHEAVCSTGSGRLLRDPTGTRQWVFDTPRGEFRVLRKASNPVWTKPDWAFIEEGKPIPESWTDRRDDDTLGDYALYFGDGYMIHGTLYARYLGRSVTHGCVRLGDEDLKRVFEITPVGARILIF